MSERSFRSSRPRTWLPLGLMLASACTGRIDRRGEEADNPGEVRNPGNGSKGGMVGTLPPLPPDAPAACLKQGPVPNAGRTPLRRLNREEWNNTIRDLIGDDRRLANTFVPDEIGDGFSNNADALIVTDLGAYQYMDAAEAVAKAALTRLPSLLPCDPQKMGELPCATQFIDVFGRRAFRRPLTSDETTRFARLFMTGKEGGAFADGIELVIQMFLQSPHFLYRIERGVPAQMVGSAVPLNPYEMATRLSYFLWGTMPDEPLFKAAAENKLATIAGIEAEARRMLMDKRAHETVATFHREFLETEGLAGLVKSSAAWTPALRTALQHEVETFADEVFWTDGKVGTFLAAPFSYLNAEAAKHYGVTATGTAFVKTALDPKQRAGVITMAGLLALHSYADQTSPIHRGKFIRERLLCHPLPAPPNNVVIEPPKVDPNASTKQRFAQHSGDPTCAGCHRLMDPIGLGFENYDPGGKWRDKDGNFPIDAQGELLGAADELNGKFTGAVELAQRLASSTTVRQCFAAQWFRFANGRAETDGDACTMARLGKRLDDNGHDLRDLLVGIAVSDAFRYRAQFGGGQ